LSFLANPKYHEKALHTAAGLVLVAPSQDLGPIPQLVMANPYWGFAQATGWLHPEPEPQFSQAPIHPAAVLGEGCQVAFGATVGARSVIGARTRLHPGVHIAEDCVVGEDCELFPGVVLYRRTVLGNRVRIHANAVLGSDGFGYVPVEGRHRKIPQVGNVVVGDDVEIGACTTVDRGALGPTVVGSGTKVDNLVQIAHNVQVGEHCVLAAHTGISGSTVLEDHVTMGGRVGVVGHVRIGRRSICAGSSVVGKDLPEGSFVSGFLARPHKEWLASQAALNRLPAILKEWRKRNGEA
jgi:UDP-3-O-[3-hydroxymyristoyl] glucosamine N-acyltransferase